MYPCISHVQHIIYRYQLESMECFCDFQKSVINLSCVLPAPPKPSPGPMFFTGHDSTHEAIVTTAKVKLKMPK
jgi:hypothetical protein